MGQVLRLRFRGATVAPAVRMCTPGRRAIVATGITSKWVGRRFCLGEFFSFIRPAYQRLTYTGQLFSSAFSGIYLPAVPLGESP